jgi:hypothetical protein
MVAGLGPSGPWLRVAPDPIHDVVLGTMTAVRLPINLFCHNTTET